MARTSGGLVITSIQFEVKQWQALLALRTSRAATFARKVSIAELVRDAVAHYLLAEHEPAAKHESPA